MYWTTETLCLLQSSQKWEAENLCRSTIVAPVSFKIEIITQNISIFKEAQRDDDIQQNKLLYKILYSY